MALGLMTCALLALMPAAASAAANFEVNPIMPAKVSLGATNLSGSIELTNDADSGTSSVCNFAEGGDCSGAQGITLVASCGKLDINAVCKPALGMEPAYYEPGVFTIQSATAGAGTACADKSFTVVQVGDPAGTVRFTPNGKITLPPQSICRINFTFDVSRLPTYDASPGTDGRQTLRYADAVAFSDEGLPLPSHKPGAPTMVTLAPPTFIDTNPSSPANFNTPQVRVTAPAGTVSVRLYSDPTCTTPIGSALNAPVYSSPGFSVSVNDNSATIFHAVGTDGDGGTTPCSSSSLTYVEDSAPPVMPVLSETVPGSPSNVNSPRIKGTAEAGSTVRIYAQENCSGDIAGQGTAAAFAMTGLLVLPVESNATTTFYATATDVAGNLSACSAFGLSYVEDSVAPSAPSPSGITPPSPSGVNDPMVAGAAPAGTTVQIYKDAGCNDAVSASASAATFASPGISVTVPDNTATTFYATATDIAGNESACSSGVGPYVEDSLAPSAPAPSGSQPASPSADNSPRIKGTAGSGSTVRLYTDASCTGAVAAEGSAAEFASPGLVVTVTDDTATTFYARATDAAGNASACALGGTYVEDSKAPQTAIDSAPSGPTATPTFTFSASEPGSAFECRVDGNAFAICTSPYTVAAGLPAGAHTFEVRAVDAAGNRAVGVVRGFTVTGSSAPASPPSSPRPPAQTGCLGITGTVYLGTSAANTRTGGAKTDIMFGLGGNDSLRGASGMDCLYGAAGRDTLRGGNGNDRLFGGTGNDRLEGQAGSDRLSGQAGNDRLIGGPGNDTLTGDAGRDNLTDSRGRDRFSGGAGIDRIDSRDTRPADRRAVDRVLCGSGRDVVFADARDRVARDCERVVRRSLPATY